MWSEYTVKGYISTALGFFPFSEILPTCVGSYRAHRNQLKLNQDHSVSEFEMCFDVEMAPGTQSRCVLTPWALTVVPYFRYSGKDSSDALCSLGNDRDRI